MTGESFWAWAGLMVLIAGIGVLYLGVRPGRPDTMTQMVHRDFRIAGVQV